MDPMVRPTWMKFWAEVITKGIHGRSDKYTKKAISIAKKYKL